MSSVKTIDSVSTIDYYLRIAVIVGVLTYVLLFGSVFEVSYPRQFVELYAFPWWRLLIVSLVGIGTWWCPRVGLALAIAAFLYLNDMDVLTNSFIGDTNTKKQ